LSATLLSGRIDKVISSGAHGLCSFANSIRHEDAAGAFRLRHNGLSTERSRDFDVFLNVGDGALHALCCAPNSGAKFQGGSMAKRRRRYSRGASRDVAGEMRRYKRGTAKSGRGGKGGRVKSRKQAIAIGLSKARKKGKKVPRKAS
jgi:hypothetical protein